MLASRISSCNFADVQQLKTRRIMTEYVYIMAQCRRFRSLKWDETELSRCREMLKALSREDLLRVYKCRFLSEKHPLREGAFKLMFSDKIGKREERIRTMPVEELIAEFQDKKGGNVALARKEMHERYKRNQGDERQKIRQALSAATKADQQWLKSQDKREEYERTYGRPYPEWKPNYKS